MYYVLCICECIRPFLRKPIASETRILFLSCSAVHYYKGSCVLESRCVIALHIDTSTDIYLPHSR